VPVYAVTVLLTAPGTVARLLDAVDQAAPAAKGVTSTARRVVDSCTWVRLKNGQA
jgi:hypothetical protein